MKAPVKKPAAKKAPARACKPKALSKAEADAWWKSQDEQTRELVKAIQGLKRIF